MPVTDFTADQKIFEWLDIENPTAEELLKISEEYHLHQYTLRDCLEPDHLPKREEFGKTEFLITRLLNESVEQHLDSIQEISNKIAIFYNKEFLITVHRRPQHFLDQIREKYVTSKRIKSTGELATKVLWHVLNSYDKPALQLSGQVDVFETKVFLKELTPGMMEDLYYIKRKASVCRKLLLLTGEVINSIRTDDTVSLQDVKDLHVKLLNVYGQVYEDVTNLLNTYLSMTAQKTNDVMRVLTIFSVFFMPLTFIVGIYGMNFEFMPELKSKLGYPGVLIFMVITSALIFIWFKRKKWL